MIKRIDKIYRSVQQEYDLLPEFNPYEYGIGVQIVLRLILFLDGDLGDETDSEKVDIFVKLT